MIASWMLYALVIGALLTISGWAAERAFAARGRPTRFIWAATLALSIAWPFAPSIARLLPAPTRAVRVLPFTIVVQTSSPTADDLAAIARAKMIDRGLIALWLGLSAFLLARLGYGVVRLQRSRSAWKRGRVNGVQVKLSDNVGPAVVGLRSMDVVLPEWILSLDEPLRAIVLRHEEEHRNARDPYLLFGAAVAVALMPWNVALWIQARRLRLTIEMDCDARVLRAHPSPERYAMLILTIAQRRSVAPTMFAPMLSEPTTNLERRILAMRTTTTQVARMTVYGSGLVAAAVLVFASSLQSAGARFPRSKVPAVITQAASLIVPAVKPETIPVKPTKKAPPAAGAGEVRADTQTVRRLNGVAVTAVAPGNAAPRYPDMLLAANVEGAVMARYRTDDRGNVDSSSIQIVSATHALFRNAVLKTLPSWHLAPGVSVETPFLFVLSSMSAKDLALPGAVPAGAYVVTAAAGNAVAVRGVAPTRQGPQPVRDDQTFFEFQVEKPATPRPGNPAPRYPDLLRSAEVEGEVLAQFVVGPDGHPDMDTFKVLKSTHELFSMAVKSSLPNMSFTPADVGGHAVKQLIQMPFQFSLARLTPPIR